MATKHSFSSAKHEFSSFVVSDTELSFEIICLWLKEPNFYRFDIQLYEMFKGLYHFTEKRFKFVVFVTIFKTGSAYCDGSMLSYTNLRQKCFSI